MKPETVIYHRIIAELEKAEYKHPDYPVNLFEQLAIINEEVGEINKAALHLKHENGSPTYLMEEVLQTAAMCVRWLKNDMINNIPYTL